MRHVTSSQPSQRGVVDGQMRRREEPVCYFSVVRYVADTIRNEPRNVGVLVVCHDREYGGVQFNVARSGIPTNSPQYTALEALFRAYKAQLPGHQRQASLFAPMPPKWARDDLEALHQECTNAIQFTAPAAALGEPTALLEQLFRERVSAPKEEAKEVKAAFSAKVAARVVRQRLERLGAHYRVEENAPVPVGKHTYTFDVAVSNGRLKYAIEALSFQVAQGKRLRRAEEAGAWYAHVWPTVAKATGAHGYLLVEPPSLPTEQRANLATNAAQDEYQRVTDWAHEAGIQVRGADEVGSVADEILSELQEPQEP